MDAGRISRPDILDPRRLSEVRIVQAHPKNIADLPFNRLGPGEQSVMAYALANNINLAGLDDRQAHEFALHLGLHVIGTVGLILTAKEAGVIAAVRPLVEQLQKEGLYIGRSLLSYALNRAGEG